MTSNGLPFEDGQRQVELSGKPLVVKMVLNINMAYTNYLLRRITIIHTCVVEFV